MYCIIRPRLSILSIAIVIYVKQLKSKSCLTNHTLSTLHHVMLLVINVLRGEHKDADTHILTHEPKQFQETRNMPAAGTHVLGFKNAHNIVKSLD